MSTASKSVGPSTDPSPASSTSGDGHSKAWKVAVIVLAVAFVAAVIWAVVAARSFAASMEDTQAQVKYLQDAAGGGSGSIMDNPEVKALMNDVERLQADIKSTKKSFGATSQQLMKMKGQYDDLQKMLGGMGINLG